MLDSNTNSRVTWSFRLECVSPGILGPVVGLWSVPFSILAGFYLRKALQSVPQLNLQTSHHCPPRPLRYRVYTDPASA